MARKIPADKKKDGVCHCGTVGSEGRIIWYRTGEWFKIVKKHYLFCV